MFLQVVHDRYGEYFTPENLETTEDDLTVYPPQIGDIGEMYTGQWKWGKKHGRGTQIWPDGFVYEGEWMQGRAAGQGRLVHSSGEYYVGEWFDNKCQGFGKYVNANAGTNAGKQRMSQGSNRSSEMANRLSMNKESTMGECCEYEGMWENDKQHGKGTEKWPDGSRYEGDFVNGLKQGQGTLKWVDGSSYEGDFHNNHI